MNRHERRRRAAASSRVGVEVIRNDQLERRIRQQLALGPAVVRAKRAMRSASPPVCGACDAVLTTAAPPRVWIYFQDIRSGAAAISAVCCSCARTRDFVMRAAKLAGLTDVRVITAHGGRA